MSSENHSHGYNGWRVFYLSAALFSIAATIMFNVYPICGDDGWYLSGITGEYGSSEALSSGMKYV